MLEDIVKLTARKSLTGLEWAAGIPGTVGGAIHGNAGAFNYFISDLIKSVEVLDLKTLKIKNLSKKDCKFSHKDTIFKKRKNLIIISAVSKLKKGNRKEKPTNLHFFSVPQPKTPNPSPRSHKSQT